MLVTTVLGSGMATLDGTVVNVALPALGRDLHAGMSGLQWTVNAYTLTMAALILLGGSLGDRLGRRKIFVTGVVWFALASALCGAAPSTPVLVLARALQGIGGALLIPGSLAIIQASYVPDDRPRAVGAWSGLGGVAAALGPLFGGWLVETAGWRWVFLLNLPLAAVVVSVATRHVPETRDPGSNGRFDVLGTVLAAPALAGLTYGLILAGDGLVPLAAGIVLSICFVVVEIRRSPRSLVPVGVFASREFTAVNVVTLVMYAAMGLVFFLLVVQLQVSAGFSPIAAGSAMLPVTILMLLLSPRAGDLAKRAGPRLPMTAGILLCAAGLLLMSRIAPDASYLADVLGGGRVRARPVRRRRPAHRDRARHRGGSVRGRGQRDQQRPGPDGRPAGRRRRPAAGGPDGGRLRLPCGVHPGVPHLDAGRRGHDGRRGGPHVRHDQAERARVRARATRSRLPGRGATPHLTPRRTLPRSAAS